MLVAPGGGRVDVDVDVTHTVHITHAAREVLGDDVVGIKDCATSLTKA